MDNPFFHRGAIRRPEQFQGRQAEINQILGLLRNGQSVSLIGPRRIGKSSLLLQLARPESRAPFNLAAPQSIFISIDCQEFGGSPPEEIYEALLAELFNSPGKAYLTINEVERFGSYRSLDRALNQLYQQGVSVVILLDEFELLAANRHLTPYFFARLRGLTTKYGLAYLTASQRPLFDITADEQILSSPFFNIFVTLPLGLYQLEEARQLLQARLQHTGLTFSAALTDHLLQLAGPHPFFLHIAGYHTFQCRSQGQQLESRAELAQLEAAIEIESLPHFSYLWQNLSAEEQYTLAVLNGAVDSVRLLEQQCLIELGNGHYHYTSELLRRFVRRQQVPGLLQAGPFVIDQQRHTVRGEGRELTLTNSQFDLLVRLAQTANQVVHSEDLEAAVWTEAFTDEGEEHFERLEQSRPDRLKTLIKRLRRAIEPYDNWIVSERGIGYTLRPPEDEAGL